MAEINNKQQNGEHAQQCDDTPVDKLKREVEYLNTLAHERLNQLKYLQADFDNYRKRFDKEKESIIQLANENLIKELLIILDDFERALQSAEDGVSKEGLTLIHKNFFMILEKYGLKQIEALGKKLDPYHHEAMLKEKSDKGDGIVLEELQKGYSLK